MEILEVFGGGSGGTPSSEGFPPGTYMRNICLLVEFDGGAYGGWQVQQNAPTVQGELVKALSTVAGEEVTLVGSSRTDAGVHALGFVANFKTSSAAPLKAFADGVNSLLPSDIVVLKADEVADDFDARRSSKGKTYLYRVLNRTDPTALDRERCWHVREPLDIDLMKAGAKVMVGEKDFASFMAADSDVAHSVREVTSVVVEKRGDFIEIEVRGTAFLRHMVRIMAGALVAVGRARVSVDELRAIIEAKDRTAAPRTAPPEGLFLVEVDYEGGVL